MKITLDQITKSAERAQIKITKEQLPALTAEINSIFDYLEILFEADTEGVEPTFRETELKNILRQDQLDQTPKPEPTIIKTPKVL